MQDEHDVGYGKPPKHSQFKKGQSGNKNGRPKGSQNLATLFHKELAQRLTVIENGERRTISKREGVVKQVVNKALAGDAKTIQVLMNISRELGDLRIPKIDEEGPVEFTLNLFERDLSSHWKKPIAVEHKKEGEDDASNDV
jgi:hypothetical protein